MVAIAHSYNMNCPAISMILKNKDKIMEHMKFDVENNIEKVWRSDGGDEETSYCVDAGSATVSL